MLIFLHPLNLTDTSLNEVDKCEGDKTMENCIFEGERICSLDIDNEYGNRDNSLILKWKYAQNNNQLICEDCGSFLDFKAGTERTPHFAHKKGITDRVCYYDTHKETEEHRNAKKLFYDYFKLKYPDSLVEANKKILCGKRIDILISFKTGEKLAVEFLRSLVNISDWEEKHQNMTQDGILDLWFFSINLFQKEGKGSKNLDLLPWVTERETSGKTALFLNVAEKLITMAREIEYKDEAGKVKHQEIFYGEYSLNFIEILPNGFILSEFEKQYQDAKAQFLATCKLIEDKEKARYERLREHQEKSESKENYKPQTNFRRNNFSDEHSFPSVEINEYRKPSKWEVEMNNEGISKASEILEMCKQTQHMQKLIGMQTHQNPKDEGLVKLMIAAETMLKNWMANPIPANKDRAIMRIDRLAIQMLGTN